MQVRVLGTVDVVIDGRPTDLGGARLRALLARLALDPGHPVSAQTLVDDLWGEDSPADAANALQSLVSRLRRTLPSRSLESVPGGYRLAIDPDDVDGEQFVKLARAGREALDAGDPLLATDRLDQALALWRGSAFGGIGDVAYVAAPLARLADARTSADEDRLSADVALGRFRDALRRADALVELEPLRERARALHMQTLAALGRQADALASFEQARRLLADELGADPSPELAALHVALLRGEPLTAPVPTTGVPRTNVRAQLTSFVGRASEVVRLESLLQRARLVTLVGPGGAGKTRLAAEAAAAVAARMPYGAWFVELAPVTSATGVVRAIEAALGAQESMLRDRTPRSHPEPFDRVVGMLTGRRALLVLDNCEHLIGAAADIADRLLAACPDLVILATSREPLAITGESLMPVGTLAVPVDSVDLESAATYASVQLFLDRVEAVRPGFLLSPDTLAAVVEICQRLDGLPLALELAAARTRTLGVDEVAARLGDRFRLLTGGSRTALPRHRTLRAVVEWSWDLLTEGERALIERLSVFAGGATIDAAETVCAGGAVARADVVDLLSSLVDKSLLAVSDGVAPRYRMLETVREYALERLTEQRAIGAVRDAHARYFAALAKREDPRLRRADQLDALAILDAERDNMAVAMRWLIDEPQPARASRMALALAWYWTLRTPAEALTSLREVLALAEGPGLPAEHQAMVAATVVFAAGQAGEYFEMLEAGRRAIELRERVPHFHNEALDVLTPMYSLMLEDDRAVFPQVHALISIVDPWLAAVMLTMRGLSNENYGDADAALADLEQSLSMHREIGDRWARALTLRALADLRRLRDDHEGVITALTESLGLAKELQSNEEIAQTHLRIAAEYERVGDRELVEQNLKAAMEVERHLALDARLWTGIVRAGLAHVAGDSDGALAHIAEARSFATAPTTPPQLLAYFDSIEAMIRADQGELTEARSLLQRGLATADRVSDMPVLASLVEALAVVTVEHDDPAAGVRLLGASAALRGTLDEGSRAVKRARAAALLRLSSAAYDTAYAAGRALPRDEILALILEPEPEPEPEPGPGLEPEPQRAVGGADERAAEARARAGARRA